MTAADNVRLFRGVVDAVNANDMETVAKALAPEFLRHDLAGYLEPIVGQDGIVDFLGMLRQALPDMRVELEDVFATEERVALRITIRGTHTGDFMGVAPTGRAVSFAAMNIYRMEQGRAVESWQLWDWAGALQQMGVTSAG